MEIDSISRNSTVNIYKILIVNTVRIMALFMKKKGRCLPKATLHWIQFICINYKINSLWQQLIVWLPLEAKR
jgi:hypothetical protein